MNKLLLDIPEYIETPNLILKIPKAGFGADLYEAIMDGYDDYIKWLNWPSIKPTPSSIEEDCRRHHAEFILRDCIRYLIIEKKTNKIVGRCAFPAFQAKWDIPQFGISYFIRKAARSKNYATESAHALTLLAFQVLQAKKVEIYCDAENIASSKIPIKLNFTFEFTQKGGWKRPDNQLATLYTYSIFSKDDLPAMEYKWH